MRVCARVCAPGFERWWAFPSEVKKMGKKFFFFLRCQITGWKVMVGTKSGFEFMTQRDPTGRFFSTDQF